ncbi:TetR/AcrR family transcriptional regulator [Mobiluncus curtisii]|uniref:TetR/AcrR family transcriptional regulator n=1 Tax=Mobiluncus curtisii TaxID=2051 RepID=UPI002430F9D2|nr:TetR/AcrR family transcriptional regulator [Mobiluncus curtisii]
MGKPNRVEIVGKLAALFQARGYTGAGMAEISATTGLGRGSLYHLFPDGKAQMMREVLVAVEHDFQAAVVTPLEAGDVTGMFTGILAFFDHGEKQSIWGKLVHDAAARDFAPEVQAHFNTWRAALTKALLSLGVDRGLAASLSERTLSGVEGTLTLAAGFDDAGALSRGLRTMSAEVTNAISAASGSAGKSSHTRKSVAKPAAKPARKPAAKSAAKPASRTSRKTAAAKPAAKKANKAK